LPGLVSVSVDQQEIEYDVEVLHWDPVGFLVLSLLGAEVNLRTSFVPTSLRFPNQTFWLTIHNDQSWGRSPFTGADLGLQG